MPQLAKCCLHPEYSYSHKRHLFLVHWSSQKGLSCWLLFWNMHDKSLWRLHFWQLQALYVFMRTTKEGKKPSWVQSVKKAFVSSRVSWAITCSQVHVGFRSETCHYQYVFAPPLTLAFYSKRYTVTNDCSSTHAGADDWYSHRELQKNYNHLTSTDRISRSCMTMSVKGGTSVTG